MELRRIPKECSGGGPYLTRICWMRRLIMQHPVRACLFVLACLAALVTSTRPTQTRAGSCLVTVVNGSVQGLDHGAACAYLGIPYAAPPTGERRWTPPRPAAAWGLLNAVAAPASCTASEDCLKLNVWTSNPSPGGLAPVLVWLHTGGFSAASANFASHNGERLAIERGVVVVAPNYRLGPFGFLAHPALSVEDAAHPASGNYGLMDQRAALEWVRDNIAQFGGDPANVTIAGTSAGGDSTGLHLVSPESAGLFHRAIIQSGSATTRWETRSEGESLGETFAAALGCIGVPEDVLACMRSKTREQVMLAVPLASQQVSEPAGRRFWLPIVDGITIPEQPRLLFEQGAFNRVPTMIGTNRDEGWGSFISRSFPAGVDADQYTAWMTTEFGSDAGQLLSIYPVAAGPSPAESMARVVADAQFVCEARRLARLIERTNTPVFLYSYEYEIDSLSTDHVIHGVESNILFGNDYVAPQFVPHVLDAADLALHGAMAGYWTRFASAGDPNTDDLTVVHWPAFKHPTGGGRGSDKHLVLDAAIREDMRLRERQCDALEPFFFRSLLAGVPAGGQ